MLALALLGTALADDTFPIGPGPERRSYAELVATGAVKGRTGRLLVKGDAARVSALPGVAAVTTLPGGLLRVTPQGDDLALARALHRQPGVTWVMPDLRLPLVPAALPDDPLVASEWHLENTGQGGRTPDVDIDAERAWAFATGAGQLIAIVDSGTQLDHPDLSVIPGRDYVGADDDPSPGEPGDAHGTGTAGIAAAVGNNGYGVAGVAYDADVYAIRLIGGSTTTEDLYNTFIEAVDAGATVISNSWGFGSDCSGVPNYSVFDEMFDYAEDVGRDGLGAAVVFAAGNAGCDVDSDMMLQKRSVVVVAALEWWDQRASYSNYGDVIDIAAPTGLLTTDVFPGGYGAYEGDDALYEGFSGTSGATPVVSGVLALMFQANPRLTAKQARNVLCETATRVDLANAAYDADGWSPYYGCGRVDAGAAVAAVANGAPAAPVPTLVSDTAEHPRVLLAWAAAADPDGDVQGYVVRWSTATASEEVSVLGTTLDIGGDVAIGDVVTWSVAAVDPWGEGPSSAPRTLTVVAPPEAEPATELEKPAEEGGSCATAGGPAWLALVGVLAMHLHSRRFFPGSPSR